jgi:hypothetical protein
MKRFLSSFLAPFTLASAELAVYGNPRSATTLVDNIPVNSDLGSKIMSHARSLENIASVDFTWVADFSIKFQGCHHVSQWNDEAEGAQDVRIQTKRLIRFRLCPSKSCSASSAAGCSSGYGDYIIDMNTFLNSYYQAVENYNYYQCQATLEKCSCQNDNAEGDDFNKEACEYKCYAKYGMVDICNAEDPDNSNQQQGEPFQLSDYVGCAQLQLQQAEGQDQENQYFIGPYCSEQGGSIYLGLFTDDTCTEFADNYKGMSTYKSLVGQSLPYSKQSIITQDCLTCKEPQEYNQRGNDGQDSDQVSEMCEQIYYTAGKCESALKSSGYKYQINENACNYISGIKVVRKDGIITQVGSKANKTASIFIGIFVVAFVLLAAYVYYLKTKLDRVAISLAD